MDLFSSTEPLRDLRNVYSRAVFDSEIFIWGGFLPRNSILYDYKWSDQVSETRIKPSCDKNAPKMSSVDQKVFETVIWSFVGQDYFDRSKPLYGYSESRVSIFDKMSCCHVVRLLGGAAGGCWGGHWDEFGRHFRNFQAVPTNIVNINH